ncbi:MAG: FmdB family zinc ribbon protein [Candidatus Acidiferrales bacterium]
MPIYEYICEDCGERHERLVMKNGAKVTCPKCSSAKQTIQLSVFAAPASSGKSSPGTPSASSGGCGCTPRTCGCH